MNDTLFLVGYVQFHALHFKTIYKNQNPTQAWGPAPVWCFTMTNILPADVLSG